MKKFNKSLYMNILFATALLLACNTTPEPTPDTTPENKDFSTINGKTIKTEFFADWQKAEQQQPNNKNYVTIGDTVIIYKTPTLNVISGIAPDLKNIKNNTLAGTPVRYVAIGGNLTAGVRDGGYFNEGMQTSYPNLIARQMQVPFAQPYFDDTDFNGFGRIVLTSKNPTGGPVQKFNVVKNNTGIESVTATSITLKKYKGTELDNFAVPYLDRQAIGQIYGNTVSGDVSNYLKNENSSTISLRSEALYRVMQTKDNYLAKVLSKKFDFITLEFRTTETINNILGGNSFVGQPVEEKYVLQKPPYDEVSLGTSPELRILRRLEENGIKSAVLLNMPDFLALPYFNSVTADMIKNANLGNKLIFSSGVKLLPSPRIDSLLSPKIELTLKILDATHPLTRNDGIGLVSGCVCDNYNAEISLFSKRFGYPIVDIKSLYEKVIKDSFISNDGLAVTSKDFFSSDGIYPSALGQACIANEIIKVMNSSYKLDIPLITIKSFKK